MCVCHRVMVIILTARIISRCKRHDHITPVLNDLGWLTVEKRVIMKVALLVYKCRTGLAPQYLSRCLTEYKPRRALRSSSSTATLFELGNARTVAGRQAWSVSGPCIWNYLPETLREPGVVFFVSQLKTFLSSFSTSTSM